MPNLDAIHPALFSRPDGKKTSRYFLQALAQLLIALPGQKVVTVFGSNRFKNIVARQWKHYALTEPFLIVAGCQCRAWRTDYTERDASPQNPMGIMPDTLFSLASRVSAYSSLSTPSRLFQASCSQADIDDGHCIEDYEDSDVPKRLLKNLRRKVSVLRGPIAGCLLCQGRKFCIHDPKYNPERLTCGYGQHRQAPVTETGNKTMVRTSSFSALEETFIALGIEGEIGALSLEEYWSQTVDEMPMSRNWAERQDDEILRKTSFLRRKHGVSPVYHP